MGKTVARQYGDGSSVFEELRSVEDGDSRGRQSGCHTCVVVPNTPFVPGMVTLATVINETQKQFRTESADFLIVYLNHSVFD